MTRSLALVSLVTLASIGLACGPFGPIPGGRLSGEVVSAPVEDWSFASGVETIQLETRPDDPYSVNIWFVSQAARLWVGAGGGETSRWARNLIADPRVRLRIDGKLYERKAERVSDQAELDAVTVLYQTKYKSERASEEWRKAVLFRMDPR